jgi:hypothetical protein
MAVEGKRKVGELSTSMQGPVSGDAPPPMGKEKIQADATVSRPAAVTKTIELADRLDTVAGISNARGWKIFAGFIVACLLLASAVVLFATHWT